MAKADITDLKNLEENWQGKAGSVVEKFIKETFKQKVGYLYRDPMKNETTKEYEQYAFASKEDFDKWISTDWESEEKDKRNNEYVLFVESLGGETNKTYSVNLINTNDISQLISIGEKLILRVNYSVLKYDPVADLTTKVSSTDKMEILTRATGSSDSYTLRGTINVASDAPYLDIDLSKYIPSGDFNVLIRAFNAEANESASITLQVINTNLSLSFATVWENPLTSTTIYYRVGGDVNKDLVYSVDSKEEVTYPLGTKVELDAGIPLSLGVLEDGVHTIKAYLKVGNTTTEPIVSQFLYLKDPSKVGTWVILNDVLDTVINYTPTTLFKYSVYNTSKETPVISVDILKADGSLFQNIPITDIDNNKAYELNATLEIAATDGSTLSDIVNTAVKIKNKDADIYNYVLKVDNSINYAPTGGATFVLNPKLRTNNEKNPSTIINSVDGSVVTKDDSFVNFGFKTDGWLKDSEGVGFLRIPAHCKLNIPYEPLDQMTSTASMTMEFDVRIFNITDYSLPVLKVCSYPVNESTPLGLEIRGLDVTFATKDKTNLLNQTTSLEEGQRAHVAINIVYNLGNRGVNYVKIFINGVIAREFEYVTGDSFYDKLLHDGINIGGLGADIDIYGIRIYKGVQKSANDVRQDWLSTISSTVERERVKDANNILGADGRISLDKIKESNEKGLTKYNYIVVNTTIPAYTADKKGTQKGTVLVHKVGEPKHSGLITNKGIKGQGTSSKTYWKWNFQFNVEKFTDEEGNEHNAYQLKEGMPWATKLCAKLNFASSQQSHKMGSVNLFNDLWNIVVKGHTTSNHELSSTEDYRVAVAQDWFFVFEDAKGDGNPVFYGIYTFGPAKGDKATFGCDNNDYCMIEGSSNGQPLTMYQVPWIDDEVDYILEDEELSTVNYNGKEQFDYDLGTKDSKKAIELIKNNFKPANNFVYLHNPLLKFYSGSFESFQSAYKENPTQFDKDYQYWMSEDSTTSTHKKYDLVRWNPITGKEGWVNAGINKSGGDYEVLNLATQLGEPTSALYSDINNEFIKARLVDFRSKVSDYYDIKDMLFCDRFNFIIAASDNNCKNTYHYIKGDGTKIKSAGDDLDTIKKTNNIGLLTKPYYVEKHDKSESGGSYWTSANNVLYSIFEQAYSRHFVKEVLGGINDNLTMEDITNEILSAMASLSDDGTPYGCLEKYYHSIQKSIPAVAYNEVARVIYEDAEVASKTLVAGTTDQYLYSNTVSPISQALGSQLENERDWDRKRMMYISSYAMYGEFGAKDGGATTGALDFRPKADGSVDFTFTAAMWMYPSIGQAKDDLPLNRRVAAGETFTFSNVTEKTDTGLFIRGVNYYSSLGNLFNLLPPNDGKEFKISGSRLTKFTVDSSSATDKKPFLFNPPRIEIVNTPLIKEFTAKGMSETSGTLDLSSLEKAEIIDLRDSGFTDIKLPSTNTLQKVYLPASTVSVQIADTPNLQTLEITNASKIKRVNIGSSVGQDNLVKDFIQSLEEKGGSLLSLTLKDIQWTNVPLSTLEWLSNISELSLSGSIHTAKAISYSVKNSLIKAMKSIDGKDGFTLIYGPRTITNIQIDGSSYLNEKNKSYPMSIKVTPVDGNNNTKLEWFLSENDYAIIDQNTGVITVNKVGSEDNEPIGKVTARMTLDTGEVLKAEKTVRFYVSTLKVGDIVFHDGTHSAINDGTKQAIGICFYIDENIRLMCATTNMANQSWGNRDDYYKVSLSTNREPYNIPELQDKSNAGSRINTGYINSNNDFNYFSSDTVIGELGVAMTLSEQTAPYLRNRLETMINPVTNKKYAIGDPVPWGLVNTLKIINHRDLVLSDPNVNTDHTEDANYYIPQGGRGRTEMADLLEMSAQFRNATNNNNAPVLYYMAASECYAYEPTVQAPLKLADKFKAHHWWLPSGGELGRMCHYHLHRNDDDSVTNSKGDKLNIFKSLIQSGTLNAFDNNWYWTSCEYSSSGAWYVFMSDGNVSVYTHGNKNNSYFVRAVAAF